MSEKINNISSTSEIQQFEQELAKWKEHQLAGERSDDPNMVVEGMTHQIECLYQLNRIDEARTFLDNVPDIVDLDQSEVREKLADAYLTADDANYFYDWYKQNLSQREASEGDQILIYALLCHNRNSEAREVLDKVFPVLTSPQHFTYALLHIPQLIADRDEREPYYKAILERSERGIEDKEQQGNQTAWYEVALQAHYSLGDIPGFEKAARAMAEVDEKGAAQHIDFSERLLDRDNPKWKEKKVFGIGLSKTGTSSLSKALTLLDFSTAHWTNPYSHDLLTKEDIPLFDSLTDVSVTHQYREIFEEYPDAKFVLTTRSLEQWERSFLTHYARSMHATSFEDLKRIIADQYPPRFGQRYVDIHQELYFQHPDLKDAYLAHERGVLEFFKGRENQLLSLDVSKPGALQQLAEFLGVDSPQADFPHENTKEEKNTWISPISGKRRTFKLRT